MKYENRKYAIGILMVTLQIIFFKIYITSMGLEKGIGKVAFMIFIFFYFIEDIYSFNSHLIWEELRKQTKCLIEYLLMVSVIVAVLHEYNLLWKFFLMGVLGYGYSFVLMKTLRKYCSRDMQINLVIVGTGESAEELKKIINENKFTMYHIMGFLSADKIHSEKRVIDEKDILGSYDSFDFKEADEVIIAMPDLTDKEMNEIVSNIEGKVSKIKFMPKINRMYTLAPETQDYEGIMLISATDNIASRKRKILKRIIDICAGVAGIILLAPLSIMVKMKTSKKDKEGGIFYSQTRIGLKGEPIKIYKYRSMVQGAEKILEELMANDPEIKEEYTVTKKLKNDPRVTNIGKFLRRTSLDEFPQFINVIKGDMSFVGPRPYLFGEKPDMEKYYEKIVEVKPGITGMWQTHGRSDTNFKERLELDQYYYRNWNIWLDIVIILKTIKAVVAKKGAY